MTTKKSDLAASAEITVQSVKSRLQRQKRVENRFDNNDSAVYRTVAFNPHCEQGAPSRSAREC